MLTALALRAFPLEVVAPIRAILMTAKLAPQFVDKLSVVGSGFAGVADYLLIVGINEARLSCVFITRHVSSPFSAFAPVRREHFCTS